MTATTEPAPQAAPDPARGRLGIADLLHEPALLLGSGSAVMLQLAEWGVGKGVAEHSTTMDRPFDRLRTTLSYVYVMGLGTDAERQAIARMVNRAHVPIRGEGYSAFDPELQLWVAATLAEVGLQMYEKVFGPLDPDTAERLYREGWIYGTALQVREDMWPPTRAEFEQWWARKEAGFRSDEQIRRYAAGLLSTREATWLVRPVLPLMSLITRGNLSPHARDVLGFTWSARDQRRYDLVWRIVRAVYPRMPRAMRRLPARVAMAEVRWRIRSGRRVI
ncbi:oxygenase MpaB family protein [Nocardioides terrisoli]|uniref:oxygenase MpaB family protein n=1 Tax=Nocardioides terrisoli TaxID=3388267 RepID=UPI00287B6069|nr:oxygenase MpaB family protein [Nocardioides marmorisolisilvae]